MRHQGIRKTCSCSHIVDETRNLRLSQYYEVEKRQVRTEEEEESEDEERRGTGATRTSQTADCEKPFNVHSIHIKK